MFQTLLIKYWPYLAIALLSLSVWHLQGRAEHWHQQTVLSEANRKADKASFVAAQDAAKKKNDAVVAAVEEKWKKTVNDTQTEYLADLSDANARLDRYIGLYNSLKASYSTASGSTLSGTPGPAESFVGAGQGAVIPVGEADLRVCTENTVKAISWQKFYENLRHGQMALPKN